MYIQVNVMFDCLLLRANTDACVLNMYTGLEPSRAT